MKTIKVLVILVVVTFLAGTGFILSGAYNIAADDPHTKPVFFLLTALRERSIAARAKSIEVPSLDDPKLLAAGAEHYSAMCTGCHLAPGKDDTEVRKGLYPQPPNLSEHAHASPAEQFWIIKHGLKMTGMPAWGKTHDDQAIWGMVAFLQKLPEMSAEQYVEMTEGAAGHDHGGSDAEPAAKGHVDPPSTPPHNDSEKSGSAPKKESEEHQHEHSH